MINLITYSSIWSTILSIILFFVALGVLVTIHELGHFLVAKLFKVYCSDFSIGFGPKIIKIKRKKGETRFSIGIIPLGGYVSMYGEGVELPDGVNVPKERSLEGIKRWKRILIMLAGITMNFILAFVIFLIAMGCFEQATMYVNFEKNDFVESSFSTLRLESIEGDGSFNQNLVIDDENSASFNYRTYYHINEDGSTSSFSNIIVLQSGTQVLENSNDDVLSGTIDSKESDLYVLTINTSSSSFGVNNRDYSDFLVAYDGEVGDDNWFYYDNDGTTKISATGYLVPRLEDGNLVKYVHIKDDPEDPQNVITLYPELIIIKKGLSNFTQQAELKLIDNGTTFYSFGYDFLCTHYWNNDLNDWSSSSHNFIVQAANLWAKSTTLISQAIGNLFVGEGWENIGGPVAIFKTTSNLLSNNPFYVYLEQWGLISVNLALVNLLPFPGLDGWQVLVEIIEGSVNGIKKLKKRSKNKKQKTLVIESTSNENVLDGEINIKDDSDVTISLDGDNVTSNKEATLVVGDNTKKEEEWKIPAKVKGIMSYIGLGLLFAFAIAIFIVDIINF